MKVGDVVVAKVKFKIETITENDQGVLFSGTVKDKLGMYLYTAHATEAQCEVCNV